MAVISYNESKSGNNSLIVHGNEEELKEVAEFVNSMYDNVDNLSIDKDMVNHPSHYEQKQNGGMECIDEMILVFGKEAAMNFCLLNCWKYRYRAPYKNNAEQDMQKSRWYLNKYKELKGSTTVSNQNITHSNLKPLPYNDCVLRTPYPYTDDKKVWCGTTTNTTMNS
jgi:hypothetical protein|nr:MAG TPA: nucelotide kinase [Caudoviricetes sp.]